MPTDSDKTSSHKQGAKVRRVKGSQLSTKLQASGLPSGFEDLDEGTLLSLSVDAPIQLSPPPNNSPLIPETTPTPLSKMHISNKVMAATLERLGFGPPNDLSSLLTSPSPSPTPANSEASITGSSGYEEEVPTAEGTVPTLGASHTDDSDAYGQIKRLFQQIAQRTGHPVDTLILEWALLHARTDMVKKHLADIRMLDLMAAQQKAFDEEVNKAISLGTGLADVGIDFMFVMVRQNATKDVNLGKVWSTPGLQGMLEDLSLSDNEILAAANMRSNSFMWSRVYKKYKQDRVESLVEDDNETHTGFAATATDISSYVTKQSAAAASAFVSASCKTSQTPVSK